MPAAAPISFTEFIVNAPKYDGVLISLPSIAIGSIDSAGWQIDLGGTPMTVGKTLSVTLPAATAGQNLSTLIGVGESFVGPLTLLPRTSSDIVLDPFVCAATIAANAC